MKFAVLGATGAVGRTMLRVLEERDVDVDELVPLASPRSAGSTLAWRGRDWTVRAPDTDAFRGCAVALFSAGSDLSREWAPRAADAGAVVIDNSSAWRMTPDVPLVVPEINGDLVGERPRGVIANPNCSTIQVALALEALRRAAGLERVLVTTLQSVSGAGRRGLAALEAERAGERFEESPFAVPIDGNVVPAVGPRDADGWNEEETKVRNESRKILGLPDLSVAATCARVPVRTGHAAALIVELTRPLDAAAVHDALAAMPGVAVTGSAGRDPLPIDVAGTDDVRVGRIRVDYDDPRVVHLWVVADNLRKGAATNAVQIAERVVDG